MEQYDIIIIGAGPGGLTAGIYAGRQGTKTLMLDKGFIGGVGREVPEMENYPGFDLISGLALIEKMKGQCEKNVEIHEFEGVNTVLDIEDGEYHFEVQTDKASYLAKTIIIATGSEHMHLNVPGELEYKGLGVSYCATCDGLFFQDKEVVMVGGGNTALQEALFLSNLGCKVTVVHRRDEFRAQKILQKKIKEKGIKTIMDSTVTSINGQQVVESVTLENTVTGDLSEYPTDAVFISIGYKPHTKIAEELGIELDETGHIITDKWQKTNKKYIYSAGDVCGGLKQWIVACGEGAIAATSAYKDIEI
ncbi:MAG: FAD-dependent oxidoreductase [Methanobrevibacter sp.]|uniref:NAD(P)/FAD-dependent oxidoreductase n=1 Tax=Methanobrevibacter sp. TaxID=66852 RepID=UPI0026DFA9FF|nr:FAD-dependent oxidoreductase [Methanobrevibacter sp.]MDO5848989.1 FAD-dependent oxidoreductase [Methanobrevibacter sp.]